MSEKKPCQKQIELINKSIEKWRILHNGIRCGNPIHLYLKGKNE
jgi:hypothetical protein